MTKNQDEPSGGGSFFDFGEEKIQRESLHTLEPPEDEGMYGTEIVDVRMNSNGDIMETEYCLGLIRPSEGDAHPDPEVISTPISERSEVERAITDLPEQPEGWEVIVLHRYVTDWKAD